MNRQKDSWVESFNLPPSPLPRSPTPLEISVIKSKNQSRKQATLSRQIRRMSVVLSCPHLKGSRVKMLQVRNPVRVDLMVDFNLTGLSRGGQQVQKARETYIKAVGTLVELASLQVRLDELRSLTYRRHSRSSTKLSELPIDVSMLSSTSLCLNSTIPSSTSTPN